MGNGWVFPNALGAIQAQQQVDAALGYPKPGQDVGGGIHAPPSQSVTTTYFAPTSIAGSVYYVADAQTVPLLGSQLGVPVPIPYSVVTPGVQAPVTIITPPLAARPSPAAHPATFTRRRVAAAIGIMAVAAGVAFGGLHFAPGPSAQDGGAAPDGTTDAGSEASVD